MLILITNKKDSEQYVRKLPNLSEARDWVTNHLDLSKEWTVEEIDDTKLYDLLRERVYEVYEGRSKATQQDRDMLALLSPHWAWILVKIKESTKKRCLLKHNKLFREQFGIDIPFDVRMEVLDIKMFDFQALISYLNLYREWKDTDMSAKELIKQKYGDEALKVVKQVMEVY